MLLPITYCVIRVCGADLGCSACREGYSLDRIARSASKPCPSSLGLELAAVAAKPPHSVATKPRLCSLHGLLRCSSKTPELLPSPDNQGSLAMVPPLHMRQVGYEIKHLELAGHALHSHMSIVHDARLAEIFHHLLHSYASRRNRLHGGMAGWRCSKHLLWPRLQWCWPLWVLVGSAKPGIHGSMASSPDFLGISKTTDQRERRNHGAQC